MKQRRRRVYVPCDCGGHLLEMILDTEYDTPLGYINLYEHGVQSDNRLPFWNRIKTAWWAFKGTLVNDSMCLNDMTDLKNLRDELTAYIKDFDTEKIKLKHQKDREPTDSIRKNVVEVLGSNLSEELKSKLIDILRAAETIKPR